jgi:hypothetical protein
MSWARESEEKSISRVPLLHVSKLANVAKVATITLRRIMSVHVMSARHRSAVLSIPVLAALHVDSFDVDSVRAHCIPWSLNPVPIL